MTRLITWLRGIWLGGKAQAPPQPARRRRQPYLQRPCSECGRSIAHTSGGVPWPHRCPAPIRVMPTIMVDAELVTLPIRLDVDNEVAS
jgi:hypothetical protein